jgi:hypothetical protein
MSKYQLRNMPDPARIDPPPRSPKAAAAKPAKPAKPAKGTVHRHQRGPAPAGTHGWARKRK